MMKKANISPTKPKFATGKKIEELYGVTREFLKNARERSAFSFYKPKGTNIIFYNISEFEAWIESAKI